MSLRRELTRNHPDFPLLEASDRAGVEALLRRLDWLDPAETVAGIERAGEGNMNLVLRVTTDRRSVILKQSRPWVERYESIAAPLDRALIEQRFYRRVQGVPGVAGAMPRLLAADRESYTLLLEDLGPAQDLTVLYRRGELVSAEVSELGAYLRALHGATWAESADGLRNREMRKLNHLHIFEVPYTTDTAVDVEAYEPGLAAVAATLRGDSELRREVEMVGERYLADGPCLVHGDFFPGSWLRTPAGLKVIDPEFCHFGEPELDLGVAIAHFVLARQFFGLDQELMQAAVDPDSGRSVSHDRIAQYAGAEVIRRLIGVAQLPIPPTCGFRAKALEQARVAIVERTLEGFRT